MSVGMKNKPLIRNPELVIHCHQEGILPCFFATGSFEQPIIIESEQDSSALAKTNSSALTFSVIFILRRS